MVGREKEKADPGVVIGSLARQQVAGPRGGCRWLESLAGRSLDSSAICWYDSMAGEFQGAQINTRHVKIGYSQFQQRSMSLRGCH